jgi:nitroreductase
MSHDLEDAILARRSTRMFLRDKQVPKQLVTEALELAIHAPSNSNVQPWHVVFASGRARDRLVAALLVEARSSALKVPPLPAAFARARSDLGAAV